MKQLKWDLSSLALTLVGNKALSERRALGHPLRSLNSLLELLPLLPHWWGSRRLGEDKAQSDAPQPSHPICATFLQETTKYLNVNTLLEGKTYLVARPLVSKGSSLAWNFFWTPPFYLTSLNPIVYNQLFLTTPEQLFFAHGSCPRALIKPPFCTKDISRVLSWPSAPDWCSFGI